MNGPATVNLVGITGIARRLVQDGHLGEADARKALDETAKDKSPITQWLLSRGLVSGSHIAQAQAVEFGMPMIDVAAMDPAQMPVPRTPTRSASAPTRGRHGPHVRRLGDAATSVCADSATPRPASAPGRGRRDQHVRRGAPLRRRGQLRAEPWRYCLNDSFQSP